MNNALTLLFVRARVQLAALLERADRRPRGDDGYSAEAAIVTGLLVLLAVGVIKLISAAVMKYAASIQF